jgi:hypothetical protein
MVAPIVAVPAAAALAGGGAAGIANLTSSGGPTNNYKYNLDRDTQNTVNKTSNKTTSIQNTYSPQTSRTVNYNPQVQIDSPDASIGSKQKLSSKKSANPTTKQPVRQPVSQVPSQRSGQTGGGSQSGSSGGQSSLVMLGALAAGAYVLSERGGN